MSDRQLKVYIHSIVGKSSCLAHIYSVDEDTVPPFKNSDTHIYMHIACVFRVCMG